MDFSPELAIICTPPDTVAKTIKRLGEAGVRTAIVMTGACPGLTVKPGSR